MNAWRRRVAPRAGAWIETGSRGPAAPRRMRSPPARGRGLKLLPTRGLRGCPVVAPARGRGLKRCASRIPARRPRSPPARGRGLKHSGDHRPGAPVRVAPRAGAWIETFRTSASKRLAAVAPRAGAWIETSSWSSTRLGATVAPAWGGGLKPCRQAPEGPSSRRPRAGRELKRSPILWEDNRQEVAARARVRIEPGRPHMTRRASRAGPSDPPLTATRPAAACRRADWNLAVADSPRRSRDSSAELPEGGDAPALGRDGTGSVVSHETLYRGRDCETMNQCTASQRCSS